MKILIIDIETKPHQVFCWGFFDQYIDPMSQVAEPGGTISWAAKWYGERKMEFRSSFHDGHEVMVRRMYDLMDEADMIIHYNGNKFDIPHLHKEFVMLGLTPPAPSKHVDMLKVVKRRFRFPSNKMDFVCRELELGGKTPHKGMQLWRDCMEGLDVEDFSDAEEHVVKAWNKMRTYNKQDVNLTEKLYDRIKGWIPGHPNHGFFSDGTSLVCPTCGSPKLQRRGTQHLISRTYQRYCCQGCGAWCRDECAEVKRKLLRTVG